LHEQGALVDVARHGLAVDGQRDGYGHEDLPVEADSSWTAVRNHRIF
jgi:hypothetical protein